MVWVVINWRRVTNSSPSVTLFKSKKSAVKYMIDYIKFYVEGDKEVLGKFKTWEGLMEALISGKVHEFDTGDDTRWTLEKQNRQ